MHENEFNKEEITITLTMMRFIVYFFVHEQHLIILKINHNSNKYETNNLTRVRETAKTDLFLDSKCIGFNN